jgi:hypothetical protein
MGATIMRTPNKYPTSQVAWACAAAAAHNSTTRCGRCQRAWALPDLAPARAPRTWQAALKGGGRGERLVLPTLAWFTCVTKPSEEDATSRSNIVSLQAAIVSARINAPSLAPHVLYMHKPLQPLRHDRYSTWLRAAGARVILHRLSFHASIPESRRIHPNVGINGHVNLGTYGRMDVPQIVVALRDEFLSRRLDVERVLYTDVDVLFAADLATGWWLHQLPNFAAGTEVFSPSINAGVLLLNISSFVLEWPGMLK